MLPAPPPPPAAWRMLPAVLLLNPGELVMGLVDLSWRYLQLIGIWGQNYGIGPGCVSASTCVYNNDVGGARLTGTTVAVQALAPPMGTRTGDGAQRVVTHERTVFREGKNEPRPGAAPGIWCTRPWGPREQTLACRPPARSPNPVGSPGPSPSQMRLWLFPGRVAG